MSNLKYTKTFILEEIQYDDDVHSFIPSDSVNEGIFDKITSFFSRILSWFKNPAKLKSAIDRAEETVKYDTILSSTIKTGKTIFLKLVDPKIEANTSYVGFEKIGEFPDKSGIYQFVGSTSSAMVQSLTGTKNIPDLVKLTVLAIFPATEIKKGMPLEIKILKNIKKDGTAYKTTSVVDSLVKEEDIKMV